MKKVRRIAAWPVRHGRYRHDLRRRGGRTVPRHAGQAAVNAAGGEDTTRSRPFVYDNDEPPVLLGENRGANPVEYLLHGLAGCVTTTFVYYAAANGVQIESLESTLEGDIDLRGLLGVAPVNAGYQNIRITMKVKSNAPDAKLEELAVLAQRRSPVFNSVSKPVPVSVTIAKV